ncbi:restriction endonuclease subunit S [Helicobacter pylori]|uniref:restriction endonuclease subunit S n=1 Tax=Helicobacter pylori TaxID=210 RepID=UPI000EAD63A7|nr:restriction endonuclease subunit S [Helicobacter pylori]
MHKIERLLQTLAPKGVEFKKIGEICLIKRGRVIAKKILQENGKYPVYSSQTLNNGILGFIDTYDFDGEFLTWTTDGAYAGSVFYRNGRFSITNVCGLLQVIQDNIIHKYLYYILQITAPLYVSSGMGNPKLMSAAMQQITIPIPPLEIQQEIVKILDAFTELNTELNTELKARKKQYQYYQNMLLDFNDINQNHKDAKMSAKTYPKRLKTLLQTLAPKGVEFRKIGELFKRNKGINITAAQMKELHSEIGKVRIFAGGATKADINYKDISKKDIINCESVIIKSRGNIGFEYYNQPFSHKNEIWSYSSKTNQMLVKFLYYYLSNNQYYFQKLAQSSLVKLPQLSVSDTDEYEVPVPPLEIQQEIVKILDQFSALTTDLLAGIPAEIKARKKQYEYYREKLLTFKPLTPNK